MGRAVVSLLTVLGVVALCGGQFAVRAQIIQESNSSLASLQSSAEGNGGGNRKFVSPGAGDIGLLLGSSLALQNGRAYVEKMSRRTGISDETRTSGVGLLCQSLRVL
jgi:hypothetical protein